MENFQTVLYEALLVAFGKILAKYNIFSQGCVLKDVGQEIIQYLNHHGFPFQETGDLEDLSNLTDLFVKNGFAESLEIEPADQGQNYIWRNLYGMEAYQELLEIAENPFLSCPLNLCLYYLADKQNKKFLMHKKTFDLTNHVTEAQYEIVDKEIESEHSFDPLVLENVKLYELAHQRGEQYRQLAITDALTGISNRRYLLEEGTKLFLRAQRQAFSLSVLMLDIDYFKCINDTYGHDVGDVALRTLADICRKLVRQGDLVGRFGGEEFIIVLPHTSVEGASQLAERLRQTIESAQFQGRENLSFTLTVSIGVAGIDQLTLKFENLLSRADMALYQAKKLGRNQVIVLESTS